MSSGLYQVAFEKTIGKEISLDPSNQNATKMKMSNLYKEIAGKNDVEYNKSLVARQFWDILNGPDENLRNEHNSDISESVKTIGKLIEEIEKKFQAN